MGSLWGVLLGAVVATGSSLVTALVTAELIERREARARLFDVRREFYVEALRATGVARHAIVEPIPEGVGVTAERSVAEVLRMSPEAWYSPAAFAPLREFGAFRAEGGVVAVARVEPRVVRQVVEDARRHVLDQGVEVARVPGLADAAGEQRVTLTVNNWGDGQRPS